MRILRGPFKKLSSFLGKIRSSLLPGSLNNQIVTTIVISILISIFFFWALGIHERQSITVESKEVDQIIAKWWGQIMNAVFITCSYIYLYFFVVSCQKNRVRHPQGKIIKTRK